MGFMTMAMSRPMIMPFVMVMVIIILGRRGRRFRCCSSRGRWLRRWLRGRLRRRCSCRRRLFRRGLRFLFRDPLAFHLLHIPEPVNLEVHIDQIFLELLPRIPLGEVSPSDVLHRRLLIADKITIAIILPIDQGFVVRVHSGCFGTLEVSELLAPNIRAVFGRVDYFGVEWQGPILLWDQTDRTKLCESTRQSHFFWER